MVNKGKPLYIFYSDVLEPYLKVSFSGKYVVVDDLVYNKHNKYNISKLKLLPTIGYNQNALEALLNNDYNEDDYEYCDDADNN